MLASQIKARPLPAVRLITGFMKEIAPEASEDHSPVKAARLSSRHILGIEGMSPTEIRALLDRGNYFADHPTDVIGYW